MVIDLVKTKEDLTGKVFGRLTVIKQVDDYIDLKSGKHYARWLCKCSCQEDSYIVIKGYRLKNGEAQSCGCIRKENMKKISEANRKGNKHDISGGYGVLWTSNTNQEVYFDLIDADEILKHTWSEDDKGYPIARIGDKIIRMHRLLGYYWYDHKNRNKKDNRIQWIIFLIILLKCKYALFIFHKWED